MIRKKILLLGDFSVGKTSLIRRYVDNAFNDSYLTTIGVKISKKLLTIANEEYELLIWDIEGATPHKSIPQNYFRGASAAIFVADVSRMETVKNIEKHIGHFQETNPDEAYVIAYNKADMLTETAKESFTVTENTFFTSAKEDMNVEKLFVTLAQRMIG